MTDVTTKTSQAPRRVRPNGSSEALSDPDLPLAKLQDLFQRAVMDGDNTILRSIPGNGRTTADVLLGVYQYAYRGRLAEILGVDYPLLREHMGHEAFEEMAYAYVTAHPSDTPNVRWFGRHLPTFLKSTVPHDVQKIRYELAELELTLANAFDAPDDAVLSLENLQTVPPELWAELTFKPHASAARLTSYTAIYEQWQALQNEDDPPPRVAATERQQLIVWRKDEMARVRIMTDEEAMMWDEAAKGANFGRLCELLAVYDAPDTAAMRAAQFLQAWISAHLLTSASTTAV